MKERFANLVIMTEKTLLQSFTSVVETTYLGDYLQDIEEIIFSTSASVTGGRAQKSTPMCFGSDLVGSGGAPPSLVVIVDLIFSILVRK